MAATSQATENNQKLFRRYAKMFALSDPHVYTSHAEKLSLWLNDFKAYYTTARPEIVKLLLIAQVTLRRALGLPEHLNSPFNIWGYSEHPMAKSYIKLVKTVEPFENYFTEPGLLDHIKSLLASVSTQPITHQSGIQIHAESLPGYVSETQTTESTSNTMTSALPVATRVKIKTKKRKTVDFDLLVQKDIKALLEKQGNQGDSLQLLTEDSMMSPNSVGIPPPFEKAGSNVEVNLQTACEDQKITTPAQITEPLLSRGVSAAAEAQGTSSLACEDRIMAAPDQRPLDTNVTGAQRISSLACEDQIMTAPDQARESLPSQDTNAVEVQGISSLVCEDQIMAIPNQTTEPLPSQDTNAAEVQGISSLAREDQIMAIPQTTEPLPLQATNAPETQDIFSPACEDQIMAPPDQIVEPLLSQGTSAAETQGTFSSADKMMATPDQITEPLLAQDTSAATEAQVAFSQAITENQEIARPDSVREPLTRQNVTEPQRYSSHIVAEDQEMETGDPTQASQDTDVATEPQSSLWQAVTEGQEGQEMAAGDSGDSGDLAFPLSQSSAIETQGSAAMSISEESVPVSSSSQRNLIPLVPSDRVGNISPAQDVQPSTPPTCADNLVKGVSCITEPGKFGQEMRIVAMKQGLGKECTMTFTCTVSSSLFPKVSAWLNRNIFSIDIEQSLCLSLGCYSITELQEQSIKNQCTTLEQQTSSARSYWPQRGGLSMNVQFKDGREDLPLSPPFQVTPDGFVDVSQFLFAGKNVIELNQTIDMSQYIFVLHSHYPTRAQLQEVKKRHQRDREWQEWARHVSRPFDIPSKLNRQS